MNDFTREELEAELLRRQQAPEQSVVDRLFGGVVPAARAFMGGAAGSAWAPLQLIDLATETSPVQRTMQSTGVAETSFPGQETAYRLGEGFAPGFMAGSAVGGPVVGLGAGTVAGLANVGAKALFPESPFLQTAVNLVPGLFSGLRTTMRGAVPAGPAMSIDPETGAPLSPGQLSGSARQLLREEEVRRDMRAAETVANFDRAQTAFIENYATNLQNITNKLPPEEAKKVIQEGFERYNKTLLNNFKASNRTAFNEAKAIKGDVIPTGNVQRTIDQLLLQYGENLEVGENRAIVENLRRIQEYMLTPKSSQILSQTGQPFFSTAGDKISVERLQQNLASLGEMAYTGRFQTGRAFEAFSPNNVSPGMSKGIAASILNAFQKDLDAAASSNIPGAELLKRARGQYSAGLEALNKSRSDYANQYFLRKDMNKTTPEDLLTDISRFNSSERVALANIMKQDYPKVYDNTRSLALSNILEKYRKGNGFDVSRLYKDDPFSGSNSWIFTGTNEQNKVKSLVNLLDSVERKTKTRNMSQEEFNTAVKTASEVAGGFFGAVGKYGTQAAINSMRLLVSQAASNNEKLALLFFTPNGQQAIAELAKPRPNLNKIPKSLVDSIIAGGVGAATQSRDVSKFKEEQRQEEQKFEWTPEEIEEELRRRGALQ